VFEAYALSRTGRCDQIAKVAQYMTDSPDGGVSRFPLAHLIHSWWWLCLGDDSYAASELTEALRLEPTFVDAARLKAEILLDRGQFDQLGDVLRPMLNQKMNQSEAYAFLSESFFMQRHADLGIEAAENAVRFNPRNAWALLWLGMCRAQKGDVMAGERAIDEAVSLNPHDTTLAGLAIFFRGMQGDFSGTNTSLKELLGKDPQNAFLWMLLGDSKRLQKFYPEAVQAYQTAVSLKPYLLRAQVGLAVSFKGQGMDQAAQNVLSEIAKINPKNKDILSWENLRRP
jgi:cytochrome c-type biogenesis protein CcmH/NrfG